MSFLSKFLIDGKKYNVLECNYSLSQPMDQVNKPIGRPVGGLITLVVESEKDTDLFHWMQDPVHTKNGKVVFYKRNAMANLKVLEFTDAFCVKYDEHFVAETKSPMTITFTISARAIKLGDVPYQNLWGLK